MRWVSVEIICTIFSLQVHGQEGQDPSHPLSQPRPPHLEGEGPTEEPTLPTSQRPPCRCNPLFGSVRTRRGAQNAKIVLKGDPPARHKNILLSIVVAQSLPLPRTRGPMLPQVKYRLPKSRGGSLGEFASILLPLAFLEIIACCAVISKRCCTSISQRTRFGRKHKHNKERGTPRRARVLLRKEIQERDAQIADLDKDLAILDDKRVLLEDIKQAPATPPPEEDGGATPVEPTRTAAPVEPTRTAALPRTTFGDGRRLEEGPWR